ncbi:MAG: pyridoxal phosphate-dependent decarboxylase family protein, partial [Paracoccaceae bacterium]
EWGVAYRTSLDSKPVRAQVLPGETYTTVPASPPDAATSMDEIFADFESLIVPGMTHWQHPRFFAYFPSNASPASVVAEHLVTAMAAQCMLWQTSPAATELETRMIDWLRQAIGLPDGFSGVIQDSASSATLAAVLVMRERALGWTGNATGLSGHPRLRVYASTEVHSSIDRAIWFAGIGSDNLVRIPTVGTHRGMDPAALDAAIRADCAAGHRPAGIIACTGGTSTGACDDIAEVARVTKAHDLYLHVDAAWAGSAMICPEFRALWTGVAEADSVVFNPHKWLGANFDCSAHFIRDPDALRRTLAIQPEYLRTLETDGVTNYSEWSIPLGRRFRALKLWFLMRFHGLDGLRTIIRNHVAWTHELCDRLRATPGVQIVTDPVLALFSFRIDGDDTRNLALVEALNADGRIYLTQTEVAGATAIRFTAGSFDMQHSDIDIAYDAITDLMARLP